MQVSEPKTIEISSLFGYLDQAKNYPNVYWNYRGQIDAEWPLIPKAGRQRYFHSEWEHSNPHDWMREPIDPR